MDFSVVIHAVTYYIYVVINTIHCQISNQVDQDDNTIYAHNPVNPSQLGIGLFFP